MLLGITSTKKSSKSTGVTLDDLSSLEDIDIDIDMPERRGHVTRQISKKTNVEAVQRGDNNKNNENLDVTVSTGSGNVHIEASEKTGGIGGSYLSGLRPSGNVEEQGNESKEQGNESKEVDMDSAQVNEIDDNKQVDENKQVDDGAQVNENKQGDDSAQIDDNKQVDDSAQVNEIDMDSAQVDDGKQVDDSKQVDDGAQGNDNKEVDDSAQGNENKEVDDSAQVDENKQEVKDIEFDENMQEVQGIDLNTPPAFWLRWKVSELDHKRWRMEKKVKTVQKLYDETIPMVDKKRMVEEQLYLDKNKIPEAYYIQCRPEILANSGSTTAKSLFEQVRYRWAQESVHSRESDRIQTPNNDFYTDLQCEEITRMYEESNKTYIPPDIIGYDISEKEFMDDRVSVKIYLFA